MRLKKHNRVIFINLVIHNNVNMFNKVSKSLSFCSLLNKREHTLQHQTKNIYAWLSSRLFNSSYFHRLMNYTNSWITGQMSEFTFKKTNETNSTQDQTNCNRSVAPIFTHQSAPNRYSSIVAPKILKIDAQNIATDSPLTGRAHTTAPRQIIHPPTHTRARR